MSSQEKVTGLIPEVGQDFRSKGGLKSARLDKALVIKVILLIVLTSIMMVHDFSLNKHHEDDRVQIWLDPVGDPIGQPSLDPSEDKLCVGAHAMVSSDVEECSKLGRDILKQGGFAADAAVTVALCIGSVNSHSSGLGGGAFLVSSLHSKDEVLSIDAREQAPMGAHRNMFNGRIHLSELGGLASGVPGELKGLHELYIRHGSGALSWKQLIEPVIELNTRGFKCSEILSNAIDKRFPPLIEHAPELMDGWDFIFKDGNAPRAHETLKDKRLVSTGDHIKRLKLAETLRIIADNGSAQVFYDPEGPIAPYLASASQRTGGILQPQDFSQYHVHVEPAISLELFTGSCNSSFLVHTSAGSSAGVALLAGLNFYDSLPASQSTLDDTHKIIESMKWMTSARSFLGDTSHAERSCNDTRMSCLIKKYTSREWARDLVENGSFSSSQTFSWKHYKPGFELSDDHGTSHFSIVDAFNNSVAVTTTVNLLFGSAVCDEQTGIVLNDQMNDFSVPNTSNAFHLMPSIYNFIEPYKRPQSSMSPTIVVRKTHDGLKETELVIGAAGGSRITTAVFHAIVKVIFGSQSLLKTIAAPRIHHQLIPEVLMVEDMRCWESEANNTRALWDMGHRFFVSGPLTAMNAIHRAYTSQGTSEWHGVSDWWRKRAGSSGF